MHYYTTRTREPKLFPPLAYSEGFLRLWESYPVCGRKRKSDAYAIFLKANLENGQLEQVLQSIELHKKTTQWQNHEGKFIPTIGNFLLYRRYEDEIAESELDWNATCGG